MLYKDITSDHWVLTDCSIGSSNQSLALADELGLSYDTINIEYNALAKLPNFLIPRGFRQVKFPNLQEIVEERLKNNMPPKTIIGAGRRCAMVALSIKAVFPSVKLIQILRPECDASQFDVIILPQHDDFSDDSSRVIRVIGALNNFRYRIQPAKISFQTKYKGIERNLGPDASSFIAVAVGGDTKSYRYNYSDAQHFANKLVQLSECHLLPLFISFSNRTPQILRDTLMPLTSKGHYINDPKSGTNEHLGIVACAKYIIATGDSISMCSELSSIGKPIYIYLPQHFNSHKHKWFCYQLCDIGAARILTNETEVLEEYNAPSLSEVTKVADYIRHNVFHTV